MDRSQDRKNSEGQGGSRLLRMIATPRAVRGGHQLVGDLLVFTAGSSLVLESMQPPFITTHMRMSDLSAGLTVVSVSADHLVFGTNGGHIGVCRLEHASDSSNLVLLMQPVSIASSTITSVSCQLSRACNALLVTATSLSNCIMVLVDISTYTVTYSCGSLNNTPPPSIPWPQVAESSVVTGLQNESHQQIALFAFGAISGVLFVYLFNISSKTLVPLKAAAINASIGAEARCSITHLSALPIDNTGDLLGESALNAGAGFLLLVTLLYSKPRLLLVDIATQEILSLLALPLHAGQMMTSIILSPTLLCTSGSDRLIHVYELGTIDGIFDARPLQTLGTVETEIGRGFVSVAGTSEYIVGVTGDHAAIAYARQASDSSARYVRYNIPEGHAGKISRIQDLLLNCDTGEIASLSNTLVLSASSSDCRTLVCFEMLPLCWGVIHGCSIYDILALEPRNQQNFAVVGDENVMRIITVPGWLRDCFAEKRPGTRGTEQFVNPKAGMPAQLSLTVAPLWTDQEISTSGFVRPPVLSLEDLRRFSDHLSSPGGSNTSSEDRLLRGTTQFPEIMESCNFPGSNCMGLCQSADGAYLITVSIAGRVTEDTLVLWRVYKPSQTEPQRAGTQFLFEKAVVIKPIYGESYVSAAFLDAPSDKRPRTNVCTHINAIAVTEQATLSVIDIDMSTGAHHAVHLQPFADLGRGDDGDAENYDMADYLESMELGVQPCLCVGHRLVFVSFKHACYRYTVKPSDPGKPDTQTPVALSDPHQIPIPAITPPNTGLGYVTALLYIEAYDCLFIGMRSGAVLQTTGEVASDPHVVFQGTGAITAMHALHVSPSSVLVVGDECGCLCFISICLPA